MGVKPIPQTFLINYDKHISDVPNLLPQIEKRTLTLILIGFVMLPKVNLVLEFIRNKKVCNFYLNLCDVVPSLSICLFP